jgi:Alpha amylase, catalytic domain
MQQLYELNIRMWQTDRSAELGRTATLDDLSNRMLDTMVEQGFSWIYLIGVWPTGPLSRNAARQDELLRTYLSRVLPDFTAEDICGSPFAPQNYEVYPSLGGDAALARLRERARSAGLSLMLDFVPNHIGLDHAWVREHPEYGIRGDEHKLATQPTAYCRIGEHIFAHGRDPFFAPWRNSVQLDYSHPDVPEAMIKVASTIAAKCDGLRCDVAMLLLQDVFENTWKRPMLPFWRKCLDGVRAEHPGTLFMAEVYWNREYELQQAGFDFTFDKILYDRLLSGDAESIRAHLRATSDYQNHCVRFIENHTEQRAAARFTNPDHHRGALLITGMVPGLLLFNHGQEDGRRYHASYHCSRRPIEDGSEPHREAYKDLINVLSERARQDGKWQLLEPLNHEGYSLIGCLWTLPGHHSLVLIVNASWQPVSGAVRAGALVERDCQLQDCFSGGAPLQLKASTLQNNGIHVSLPPWGTVVYRVMANRNS